MNDNEWQDKQDRLERDYDALPDADISTIIINSNGDILDLFWDAMGIDGVIGNYKADAVEMMDLMVFNRPDNIERLGELVRTQVLKKLIKDAQPELERKGEFKYSIEDLERAIL